jgi:serine/threonine-protein kinase
MLPELREILERSYAIERQLDGGGMSRVFVARDLRLGRRVVIKVLPRELTLAVSVERFRREIQIAAQLRHPHIVPLLEAGEAAGTLYYTMPFIEGESIRARLQREGVIPLREAVRLSAEIAEALAYSHDQGIVHRDIKPENILLDGGHAVVTDFGIARAISDLNAQGRVTTTGPVGTLAYMSPEQASGENNLDGRSDVYSLACVLYEMVTGRSPISALDKVLEAEAHATQFGRLLPVLSKALAARREQRFETAAEFRNALAKETAAPRRRYLVAAAMIVAAVGGSAVLWTYGTSAAAPVSWTRRQISAVGLANWPALSPEGQFVAYVAGKSLYATDVKTGETRELAEGTMLRHTAWTSNGNEVAFQSWDTVYAVSRSGGPRRVLLAPANGNFAVSADGKRIAWSTDSQGRPTFRVGSLGLSVSGGTLDTVVQRQLGPGILKWSADGKWVAAASFNLVVVFASDGTREDTIASRPIDVQQVQSITPWMSWSPRSDTLYIDGPRAPNASTKAMSAITLSSNGTWRPPVPVDTPANYRATELSNDGRRFATVVVKHRVFLERYAVEHGLATRRLSVAAGDASDRHNDFSPDGKVSAFAREVDAHSDVYVVPASGGVPRPVTNLHAKTITAVRWSPDGASIAFIYSTDTSAGIGVVNPTTGKLRLISSRLPITFEWSWSSYEVGLVWSTDGSRLFFGATRPFRGGRTRGGVGMIDLRSGRDSLIDTSGELSSIVSPSGNQIAHLNGMLNGIVRFDWRTGRRDSTPLPFHATPLRWEHDDTMLMVDSDMSSTKIWRFSFSTGRETPVAVVPARCLDVTLTIDGRTAVCEEAETGGDVWLATRDENRLERGFSLLHRR